MLLYHYAQLFDDKIVANMAQIFEIGRMDIVTGRSS